MTMAHFWCHQERQLNCHDRILPPLPGNPQTQTNKRLLNSRLSTSNSKFWMSSQYCLTNKLQEKQQQPANQMRRPAERSFTSPLATRVDWQSSADWAIHNGSSQRRLWQRFGGCGEFELSQHHMDSCLDFAEEMPKLEHVGNELGVSVLSITSTLHSELAGKGIKCSSGRGSRGVYHQMSLNSKQGRSLFKGFSAGMYDQRYSQNRNGVQAFLMSTITLTICIRFPSRQQNNEDNPP